MKRNGRHVHYSSVYMAILVVLMCCATVGLLGVVLNGRADKDENVISLVPENEVADSDEGDTEEDGPRRGVLGQQLDPSGNIIGADGTSAVNSSGDAASDAANANAASDATAEAAADAVVPANVAASQTGYDMPYSYQTTTTTNTSPEVNADIDGSSSTSTEVELFHTKYYNSKGVLVAQSSNGDKIIAPGTSNSYDFSVKNTGNVSLDYNLSFDNSIFKIEDTSIPLEVRISDPSGKYLVGGKNSWVAVADLSDGVSGTLPVNNYANYTLEWRWPFTKDASDGKTVTASSYLSGDALDTNLGNSATDRSIAAGTDIEVKLVIDTYAEASPDAVPVGTKSFLSTVWHNAMKHIAGNDANGSNDTAYGTSGAGDSILRRVLAKTVGAPKTSDSMYMFVYAAITVGIVGIIFIIVAFRRKNRQEGRE